MAKPRGFETVSDMARSLSVVGVFVLFLFLVVWWQRPEAQGPIARVVDVPGVVSAAAIGSSFEVWVPMGLPSGWQPTSAWAQSASTSDYAGLVVHVGYLTPAGSYAEVRQTDGQRAKALDDWTTSGRAAGTVEVAGRTWRRFESPTSKSLVLTQGGALRVVTGKADWPELEGLAASLEPVRAAPGQSSAAS
ncbi:MAG: DUF4245 domain-containing protein [Actinomycetes bacterium]